MLPALISASLTIAFLIPALAVAQIVPYSQNFEDLALADPAGNSALSDDGWNLYCNVFGSDGSYWYGYGAFPAPNHGVAVSAVVTGEGGPNQDSQQLSIFSDYNNTDHGNGATIETNVYQERTIDAGNVGQIWIMTFDAKMGNLEGASTAAAFIKTLDPNNGYAMTNYITADMTGSPADWANYSISLTIDAGLEGQIFQFGFTNNATNYEGSGIFYDNINLSQDGAVATTGITLDNIKSLYR
ncbi:hypothetical protein CSB20_12585 [bacterium DOLZORAL124_64_63]|nr:MAG: hypothetical protein CSB20_12585 [bacterium DOLZORAL124_64_63]